MANIMPSIKAAAYARYSTDNQTKNSIAYQMEHIRGYCAKHSIDIIREYADEGETGTNEQRPGFQQLLDDCKNHVINAVVVYDLDRGSRDIGDWFTFRKQMMYMGIQIISVEFELGDLTDPADFTREFVKVGFSHMEVLNSRKKSIDGVLTKSRTASFLGGLPPLGYDVIRKQYVINETEAAVVKKIFSLYVSGASYNEIADAVYPARGKRGTILNRNSFNDILHNERYIGTYSWNRLHTKVLRKYIGRHPNPNMVVIENAIPPIIDKDMWDAAQVRLADRQHRARNKAKHDYPLSGLITCEACGHAFAGQCSRNAKGYETRYYTCVGHKKRLCGAKALNADRIESFIWDNLKEYYKTVDFGRLADYVIAEYNSHCPDLTAEVNELKTINMKINNAVKTIMDGLSFPELRDEVVRLQDRKKELEKIISSSTMPRQKINRDAMIKFLKSRIENWDPKNMTKIFRAHIIAVKAKTDGSYTVYVGMPSVAYTSGDPGRKRIIYTTFFYKIAA